MVSVIITLGVLYFGWLAYRNARRAGTWSNKKFFLVLLCTLGLCAVISLPIILIPADTMQAHANLFIAGILVAITVGVVLLTIYAKRWTKRG